MNHVREPLDLGAAKFVIIIGCFSPTDKKFNKLLETPNWNWVVNLILVKLSICLDTNMQPNIGSKSLAYIRLFFDKIKILKKSIKIEYFFKKRCHLKKNGMADKVGSDFEMVKIYSKLWIHQVASNKN